MNELDHYINIQDVNSSLEVYENIPSFNKNYTEPDDYFGDIRDLEVFNQIVKEKNCLIEELKNYCNNLKLKFEEEVIKYSTEVNILVIIVLAEPNEN